MYLDLDQKFSNAVARVQAPSKSTVAAGLAGAAIAANNAFADGIDTSTVIAAITAATVAIAAVGVTILGMKVGAKVYKWISSVL